MIYGIEVKYRNDVYIQDFFRPRCMPFGNTGEGHPSVYPQVGDIELGDILYVKTFTENDDAIAVLLVGIVLDASTYYGPDDISIPKKPDFHTQWFFQGIEIIKCNYDIYADDFLARRNSLFYPERVKYFQNLILDIFISPDSHKTTSKNIINDFIHRLENEKYYEYGIDPSDIFKK
jgi:hypothetical protein